MFRGARFDRSARLALVAALLAPGLLSACGGSGGKTTTGTLSFSLTDSASDDVASFTVDVTAVTVTKKNGAQIGVLANPVTVDLASLSDVSQLLSVMDVPAGFYDAASITFDFTSAVCMLTGQATPATLLDTLGNPLTGPVTLPLSLLRAPVIVFGGRHRLFELDFDLDGSLTTDLVNNVVIVEPSIIVRVDRSDPKPLAVLGALQSVDVTARTAVIDVETLGGASLCTTTLQFGALTVYQVNGVPGIGSAGLTQLALLAPGTWIQAFGAIQLHQQMVDTVYVEAGGGTYNGGSDIVDGEIVDRSGGAGADATLTVEGYSDDATHTTQVFNSLFTVNTSFANTAVVRRGATTAFTTDELNVGQRVRCFGALAGSTLDATAVGAVVREQPTWAFGYANSAPSGGALEIDLQRVNLRDQTDFNWPAGGPTPPDPAHFSLDVGSLGDTLGIVAATPVGARGFFAAFADSNQDFVATSLANLERVGSLLVIHDRIGGFDVGISTSSSQIQFTITGTQGATEVALVDQGFAGTIPLPTSPTPTVVPDAAAVVFSLRDSLTGEITFEDNFADFSTDLSNALQSGRNLHNFTALGGYDQTGNTLTALFASAVIR
jgi:hypothetical protein